ncbi:MAG TPA: hypothetical protein VL793_12680, partial [Patescibacteria group bacterium]|nr:hypothetical protein [Patescibacteria group bacterium]
SVDTGSPKALRLVSIGQKGTTVIELVETGERLTAKPGDFFGSEGFGSERLQLLSASPTTGEAFLRQR